MAGLVLTGVSKRFGSTPVLDGVSLEIAAGEFLVVLGPSGCGKSTLLRVIAGLESIDTGSISIEGRPVENLPPGQRGVAMVFQGYALYPHMSVRGNIEFGLRNAGMARVDIERRVSEVARMLEIAPLLERLPAELSGGQRQRVAIARAMVKEPKVFMFDEPLSNLDAALRGRMRQEIANLHRRIRTTMIFVTHDQTEAMTLADRIVVMNQQRIEQIGTPLEVYRHPATLFVAAFIGSPPMNLVPASVVKQSGNASLRLADGTALDGIDPALIGHAEGPVRLGFRPEAVELCSRDQGQTQGLVEFVEYLGDRSHVFVALPGGERLTVLESAQFGGRRSESVGVRIRLDQAHVFDAAGRNCRQGTP